MKKLMLEKWDSTMSTDQKLDALRETVRKLEMLIDSIHAAIGDSNEPSGDNECDDE
jgi:hypothetical protein